MFSSRSVFLPAGLLLFMVGLGVADAVVRQPLPQTTWQALFIKRTPPAADTVAPAPTPTGGVRKQVAVDVRAVCTQLGFELLETGESSLLAQVITDSPVESLVLLASGDRAGSVTWVRSGKVKEYFNSLKDALHQSLSAQVQDLRDETQEREGKPTRNYLTFLDPPLSQERIVFIRVRELLLEFHISPSHEAVLFQLVDKLSE